LFIAVMVVAIALCAQTEATLRVIDDALIPGTGLEVKPCVS
jgi:hypothetical protein